VSCDEAGFCRPGVEAAGAQVDSPLCCTAHRRVRTCNVRLVEWVTFYSFRVLSATAPRWLTPVLANRAMSQYMHYPL
jgi:hypothetical protein